MNKKLALLLLTFFISTSAYGSSSGMLSIFEIVKDEGTQISYTNASYVSKRCAGLYVAISSITTNDAAITAAISDKLAKLEVISINIDTKNLHIPMAEAKRKITSSAKAFAAKYVQEMNENYLNTGDYLNSALFDADMAFCGRITS